MIGVSAFIAKIREIAARNLTYRTGGIGKDGTCDCIGLIMGAMYELGNKRYDMHSTNYFARYQMMELRKVTEKDLHPGMILFRSRESTGKLNERYKPGGRYYTGDMLDYYHVAVVTGVKPLEIVECTEHGNVSGIVVSRSFKNWQDGGKLRGVLYEDYVEHEEEKTMYKAIVNTEKDPLRVREWPETGTILGSVPKGKTVDVLAEAGDGWPKIRYNELMGYVSEMYLEPVTVQAVNSSNNSTGSEKEETVLIRDDAVTIRVEKVETVLIREDGVTIRIEGVWRIAED
jgi:uncharacterized protein YgiM (DUF1202 family)